MVCPQVREAVNLHYIPSAKEMYGSPEKERGYSNADVRDDDIHLVHWFEIRSIAAKVKMATFPPWNDCHSSKGEVVDDQVRGPGNQLMANQFRKHTDGHIFHKVYGFRNELGP